MLTRTDVENRLKFRHPKCGARMDKQYDNCPLCRVRLEWTKKNVPQDDNERGAEQGAA